MHFLLFLFCALISLSLQQQCPPVIRSGALSQPIPRLQSSSLTLQNVGAPQRQSIFNVTLANTSITTSSYEVAIGVTYIQNYFDPSSLDFGVRTINFPTLFSILFVISQQANWTSVHMHYLVTAREDVRAGNFQVDNPQLFIPFNSTTPRNTRVSYIYPRRWVSGSRFVTVYPYMTGIKCADRFIDLRVVTAIANLTENVINFEIQVANQQQPIETMFLSYVMWTDVNSPVSFEVISTLVQNVENSFSSTRTGQFVAIRRLSARALGAFFGRGRLLAAVLSRQNLESFTNSFQLHGFVFSAKEFFQGPILTVTAGDAGRSGCANYSQCVRIGGDFITVDNQKRCVLCRNNSQFDPESKTCLCKKDFFEDSEKNCIGLASLCQQGDIFIEGNCYRLSSPNPASQCSQNQSFNITTRRCICRPGFLPSASTPLRCFPPCPANQTFDPRLQTCMCVSNTFTRAGICVDCQDSLSRWNQTSQACQCIKGTMSILGGACRGCSSFAKWVEEKGKCECMEGYSGSGVVCRRVAGVAGIGFTVAFASGVGGRP